MPADSSGKAKVHDAVFVVFLQGYHEVLEMGLVCLEEIGFIVGKGGGQKDVRDGISVW